MQSNPNLLPLFVNMLVLMSAVLGTAASFTIHHGLAAAQPLSTPASPATAIFAKEGVAIHGIDPVAYFTEGRPVTGRSEFAYEWQGATWLFSSAKNQSLFAENPRVYAPQYGGYCAYGISYGVFLSVVPEAWKILDGKLYLHYSIAIQKQWEKDAADHIDQANLNWLALTAR